MNLPSWYDSWLTNDESEAEKQCNCGNVMEWSVRSEMWFCVDCDTQVPREELEQKETSVGALQGEASEVLLSRNCQSDKAGQYGKEVQP